MSQRQTTQTDISQDDLRPEYRSFLQSLDDSQFISHISSFTEDSRDKHVLNVDTEEGDVLGRSTPVVSRLGSVNKASQSSDPFDDSFNEVLLGKVDAAASPHRSHEKPHPLHQQPHQANVADVVTDPKGRVPSQEPLDSIDNKEPDTNILRSPETETAITETRNNESTAFPDISSEIGPQHDFGEYDVYFRNKQLKQQLNDQEYTAWDEERRKAQGEDAYKEPIFKGCVIHVNGHTVPSINEIHRLVIIHGGKFLGFLNNKSAATHIICDRLTPRKRQQFKNCKVVKASWIVDCLAAKQLLDWKQYRLFKEVAYDQQRLELETKGEFEIGQFNHEDLVDEEESNLLEEFPGFEEDLTQEETEQRQEKPGEEEELDHKLVEFTNDRRDENGEVFKKTTVMDARSPGFLQHFFANSRLHHLSAWKAEVKMTFMKKILESTTSKPKPKGSGRTILHMDFDCFFATASCQKHGHLNIDKDPIAVSHGSNTSDIASCNYVARSFGVQNGMWTRSARRLCKDLIIVDYEFDLYEKCASELYNYLISMSGEFDTIFPVSIDEALIDISSFVSKFDGSEVEYHVNKLCQTMRKDVFQLTKCPISIGVSSNVLLAKLSLRKAKPNGFFYLNKEIEQFLDSVLLKDLPGVGYSLVEKFTKEFETEAAPTLLELRQIPKARLMNVFGPKTGDKLYNYARGIDNTSLELDNTVNPALLGRKSVSVDVNYGIRFDTPIEIETFMVEMGKEVSKRLQKLGLVGSQVTLKLAQRAKDAPFNPPKYLGMGFCDFFNKTSKLGVASNEWGVITAELKSLTRILNVPAKELRGIAVTISRLEDAEQFKRDNQQKLPFGSLKRERNKVPVITDTSHFKDPIELEAQQDAEIDWEVFDSLPWDIRKELKDEMIRRGIKRTGDPKDSRASSPHKVYRQQLIPSGNGHEPKYIRVVESPKKKPKSRTGSPQKGKSITPAPTVPDYEFDESYDSSVLNELPSSIRNEYIEDMEQRKKQKLQPVTLKGKFTDIYQKSKEINDPIDELWLQQQETMFIPPLFLNTQFSSSDMKEMISEWVMNSLEQDGPHEDDINAFLDYLNELLSQNQKPRCLRLIGYVSRELEFFKCKDKCLREGDNFVAYEEWESVIEERFKSLVG